MLGDWRHPQTQHQPFLPWCLEPQQSASLLAVTCMWRRLEERAEACLVLFLSPSLSQSVFCTGLL